MPLPLACAAGETARPWVTGTSTSNVQAPPTDVQIRSGPMPAGMGSGNRTASDVTVTCSFRSSRGASSGKTKRDQVAVDPSTGVRLPDQFQPT